MKMVEVAEKEKLIKKIRLKKESSKSICTKEEITKFNFDKSKVPVKSKQVYL